jgi:hypothetical protein
MIRFIESGMHDGVTLVFNSLNNIDRFKKYYLRLKVIILLNIFKVIAYITPEKNENELENNLQHDYLEILNRNKHKREVTEVPETNENVIKND